jgi:predicted RecB family nuclease
MSESLQSLFDTGHNVGELAQQLFPGGVQAAKHLPDDFIESIRLTRQLIKSGTGVIYEAGFMHDNLTCFVDILVREEEGWHIYEVKSSTSISDTNILDAAFQYHLLTRAGLDVRGVSLVYLNNQYARKGDLDIHQLFNIEPVLELVKAALPLVKTCLRDEIDTLRKKQVPDIDIGEHCSNPYSCDFMGHCWRHIPDYSVFDIAGLKAARKFELYQRGIVNLRDVPDNFRLSASQRLQVETEKSGKPFIDRQGIRSMVGKFKYPLYFLDFETFMPAVPLYDQSSPYQQLVFQYSLHDLSRPGDTPVHHEFLAQPGTDPRLQLIPRLLQDLGTKGNIIVYNQAFETTRLKELARDFPQYEKPINTLLPRIKDLMEPFRQKLYYVPEMKGSYSIKQVLPALVPGFGYAGLEISDGGMASSAFLKMMSESDQQVIEKIRESLLDYCRLDSLAMVEILKVLEGV